MDDMNIIDDRVARLTLDEKVALTMGSDMWHTGAVQRIDVPAMTITDGPHGLRAMRPSADDASILEPVPATCFPTASALASSWDVELAGRVAAAIAAEARAAGVAVVLGPGLNIKRSPLCGRNFEYFSEDPLLGGRLAGAMVRGLQENGVGACLKHFVANNQETDRHRVDAIIDDRTLREIYLAGFETAVAESSPWLVMCSYNVVNGEPAASHHWLLTQVLRDEWGFDGVVVSDWGAVRDRVASLAAGLDLEMPPHHGTSDVAVVAAVEDGSLDEGLLDVAADRLLRLLERTRQTGAAPSTYDVDEHHELARAAARRSAVLLRNDDGLLPLTLRSGSTLAVVGELARTPRCQGGGSSQVPATRVDSVLDEVRALVPDLVEVTFAPGYGVDPEGEDGDDTDALVAQAVAIAAEADVVVVVAGLTDGDETEGRDRTHLDLRAGQLQLLAALGQLDVPVVVVVVAGSAIALPQIDPHADALLYAWLGGQGGGRAIADLLLGRASPSGCLAETLPRRMEDVPSYLSFPGEESRVHHSERMFVGYRGFDARNLDVAYPFGHGLTYTTFAHDDLTVEVTGLEADGDLAVRVSVTVTNTGDRAGTEVVQVYVGDLQASAARPVRELRDFRVVTLAAGESERVTCHLDRRAFTFWSVLLHDWYLEAGTFDIAVGASSRDLRHTTTVTLDAPDRRPLRTDSTLDEWADHPVGNAVLREAYEAADGWGGIVDNAPLRVMMGGVPVDRLAMFPGLGLPPEAIADAVEEAARRREHN